MKDFFNKILIFLHLKKAPVEEEATTNGLMVAEPDVANQYLDEYTEDKYDEEKNVIIRLVSPNSKKKKDYAVKGIEDVASNNNWKAWVYLAPVIILIAIFLLYPLINTIFIAFAKDYSYSTGTFQGITLDNFGIIFRIVPAGIDGNGFVSYEEYFLEYAVPNTLILLITVPIAIALALIISVALNSIKVFQKFLQTVFFLPYVTNAVAIGLVFSVIFDKNGVINFIFGTDITWIYGAERFTAMIPLCIYIVWHSLPFKILILLSGLQGIDKQYYQAAQIDAASKFKTLMHITVPLLSPQILYLMITSFIAAFKEYTSVVSMFGGPGTMGTNSTKPDMETIVYYVYQNVEAGQTSRAAAAAVFLFVVILVFTFIQMKVSKTRVYY